MTGKDLVPSFFAFDQGANAIDLDIVGMGTDGKHSHKKASFGQKMISMKKL
jgi:hypothetical protein